MWSKAALAQFASWGGLTPEQAADAGLFEVSNAAEVYPDFAAIPAIVLPYYNPDRTLMTFERGGKQLPFCRVRYLENPQAQGFTKKKPKRYAQPGRSGTRVYFPRCLDWQRLIADVQEPLLATEGEGKALKAAYSGLPCFALGGVYNFMAGVEDLLPELELIKWFGRDQYIAFDSDATSNPNVIAAEARLVDELMRKRGAKATIIRLPPDGENKEALDTFLEKYGVDGLTELIKRSQPLGTLDAKVIALNQGLAWIEREAQVFDLKDRIFIKKENLITGSHWSSIKHITVGGKQRSEAKEISVVQKWLTHPHAQRFGECLFRPGEGRIVTSETGRPALNMWDGWPEQQRNDAMVQPFLELTDHCFSNMPPEHRDLPLKLLAYKMQHPEKKIPLALVMLGPQGSGKTLWTECVALAFKPYGAAITASQFGEQFQGFMERNLLCVVNEAEANYVKNHGERLKSLISDVDQYMNEKYRPARPIKSYTMYMLSANDPAVGSFANDDRRMIVVGVPKPREAGHWDVYRELGQFGPWRKTGGPDALRAYLLSMELGDWMPPPRAPMTQEKFQAYTEGLSLIQKMAEDMKTADEHTVVSWLDEAYAWADVNINSSQPRLVAEARAITQVINSWKITPWYEPKDLALMFPKFTESLQGAKYDQTTTPGQISRDLRAAGIPFLYCKDDPRGFQWKGKIRQFLIVYDQEGWSQPVTQADFERYMNEAPTYGAIKAARRART